jgi:hypothetical protein
MTAHVHAPSEPLAPAERGPLGRRAQLLPAVSAPAAGTRLLEITDRRKDNA